MILKTAHRNSFMISNEIKNLFPTTRVVYLLTTSVVSKYNLYA